MIGSCDVERTDLELTKAMLAAANMRYSVTVTPEGVTVLVNGRRTQNPHKHGTVELQFSPNGDRLVGMEGRE